MMAAEAHCFPKHQSFFFLIILMRHTFKPRAAVLQTFKAACGTFIAISEQ